MVTLNLAHEPDDALMLRAAWLYYIGGLTQEEAANRLGLHRTRVVRLLSEARDRGLVTITIQHDAIRDLETEHAIAKRFGLDFCLSTPPIGFDETMTIPSVLATQALIARRAVGGAAANFLKGKLSTLQPITVGVSFGRTLEQVASHLVGVRNPQARFVSLMGSLTRNSASNPFEVVQALAARTGGEGHFLPVPFIADTVADREVLASQRIVADGLALARSADLFLISVGELTETSFLREQNMLSAEELASVRAQGAVCDSLGLLFDRNGKPVRHELDQRCLAVNVAHLHNRDVVLLSAGLQKLEAARALLRTGVVRGLIVDGDTALALAWDKQI